MTPDFRSEQPVHPGRELHLEDVVRDDAGIEDAGIEDAVQSSPGHRPRGAEN
jgi:hypothetical protein